MFIRMIHQNILIPLIVVVLQIQLSATQNNSLTFSPSTPLCIGETVQMICYVVPPTAEQFIDTAALLSFNNSGAATINTINTNTLAGIDTSRYTADISGLTVTTDRPGIRLTITDYQASDGAIEFSCHGLYGSSAGGPSPIIISGYPQRLADPPSSPVVTLSQTDNSCSNTLISWSTPSSDRSITSYSVYRNNTHIYNGPDNQYTDNTQLNINTVYEYFVVAISCAGHSTAGVNTTSIGVPSTPVVTISQPDSTCSNTRISWSISDADIPILRYLTYRNNTLIYNGPDNQYTDNTQLTINTVYEYSVVAISCAGNSTAGVNTTSIGGYTLTSPMLWIIISEQSARFSWTLTAEQNTLPILIEYLIQFNYTSSDNNSVLFSQNFSQISTNSVLDLLTFLSQYNRSTGDIKGPVCIRITEQCGRESYGDLLCDDQTSNLLGIIILTIGAIIGIGVGVCFCCCCFIVLIVLSLVVLCTCVIRNRKNKADATDITFMNQSKEYVDMHSVGITAVKQPTESQYYTHMSPLDRKQLPPNYENVQQL